MHRGEPLIDHHRFQVGDPLVVESAQVAVDGIEARHDSACKTYEERIGRERFEPEDACLSDHVGIEEQPQLRLHRVDHQHAALQTKEQSPELRVDSLPPTEGAEAREAGDTGERRILLPSMNTRRIGATDASVAAVAVPTLAAAHVSTHLMDARRVRGCCSHQTLRRTRRAINSSPFTIPQPARERLPRPRMRNPGLGGSRCPSPRTDASSRDTLQRTHRSPGTGTAVRPGDCRAVVVQSARLDRTGQRARDELRGGASHAPVTKAQAIIPLHAESATHAKSLCHSLALGHRGSLRMPRKQRG